MASQALETVTQQKEALMARINRMQKEHASGIRETVGAGITVGTAFAVSWFEARYPKNKDIAGLPISLFAGGVLIGLSAFEVAGKNDSVYLGDAGRGALAAWAAGEGGAMGRKQLAEQPKAA